MFIWPHLQTKSQTNCAALIDTGRDTLDGETLAQSIPIPIHLGTLIPIVGEILKRNPVETLVDGDIFIMNDLCLLLIPSAAEILGFPTNVSQCEQSVRVR